LSFNLIVLADTMRTDSLPTIGVVAALWAEARVLTRMADSMMQGLPVKGRIVVRQSGIGLQAARRQAEHLADISELLVSFGVSSGLYPALKTGDLVLADQVLAWNPEQSSIAAKRRNDKPGPHKLSQTQALPVSFRADAGLIDYIANKFQENTIHFYRGPILCSPKPISTTASKLIAHRLTGALAADMESRAVCEVAAEAGLPFFCLRAVCDPADQTVPDNLLAMVDEQGNPRIGYLLAHLVRRPWLLQDVIRMACQFRQALIALKRAWLLIDEPFLSAAQARYTISPVRAGKQ
jgi:adenosylhomocysteine nucleosidase